MKKITLLIVLILATCSLWGKNLSDTKYILLLLNKKYVQKSDGIRMIAKVIYPKKKASVKKLAEFLISQSVLKKDDVQNLDIPMSKGFLAKMIMGSLKLKGGVGYSIFGGERYAFRECQFLGFFKSKRGNNYQYLSGSAFLGVMKRVEEHLKKK